MVSGPTIRCFLQAMTSVLGLAGGSAASPSVPTVEEPLWNLGMELSD